MVLHGEGRTAEAIRLLYAALARRFDDAGVIATLGGLLAESGDPARAERVFRLGAQVSAEPEVLVNHGVFLGQIGRLDEARRVLQAVVDDLGVEIARRYRLGEDPGDRVSLHGHAQVMLGRTMMEAGEVEEAAEVAKRWLRSPDISSMATVLLEDCVERLDLDPAAVARELHEEQNASPDIVAWLAYEALRRGDPVEAATILRDAHGYLDGGALEDADALLEAARRARVALARHVMARGADPGGESREARELLAWLTRVETRADELAEEP